MKLSYSSFLVLLFCAASLGACSSDDNEERLLAGLRTRLILGVSLADTEAYLQSQGAGFSKRSAQECERMVKESRVPTQLQPKGGPCVFGKLPVSKNWYGARNDIIFQLVFDGENKLHDGSFEAIQAGL